MVCGLFDWLRRKFKCTSNKEPESARRPPINFEVGMFLVGRKYKAPCNNTGRYWAKNLEVGYIVKHLPDDRTPDNDNFEIYWMRDTNEVRVCSIETVTNKSLTMRYVGEDFDVTTEQSIVDFWMSEALDLDRRVTRQLESIRAARRAAENSITAMKGEQ